MEILSKTDILSFNTRRSWLVISGALESVSAIFLLIAVCGFSLQPNVINNIPWGVLSEGGITVSVGLALASYYPACSCSPTLLTCVCTTAFISDADCKLGSSICDDCQIYGYVAFGTSLIALFSTLTSLVYTLKRLFGVNSGIAKKLAIGIDLTAAGVQGGGLGLFWGLCFYQNGWLYGSANPLQPSVGAVLSMLAIVFLVSSSVIHSCVSSEDNFDIDNTQHNAPSFSKPLLSA